MWQVAQVGVVVAIQHEELVVVEGGRLPVLRAVALPAVAADLAVQACRWAPCGSPRSAPVRPSRGARDRMSPASRHPACGTGRSSRRDRWMDVGLGAAWQVSQRLAHVCPQQRVREGLAALRRSASVPGGRCGRRCSPARSAPGGTRSSRVGSSDRHALGRAQADVGHGMAGDAPLGRRAAQGRVAGKAVRRQLGMRRHERPRAHHQVRIDEGERDERQQGWPR